MAKKITIPVGNTNRYEFISSKYANFEFSFSKWTNVDKLPVLEVSYKWLKNSNNCVKFLNSIVCDAVNEFALSDVKNHLVLFCQIDVNTPNIFKKNIQINDYSDKEQIRCVLVIFGTNEVIPDKLDCEFYESLFKGNPTIPETQNGSIIVGKN